MGDQPGDRLASLDGLRGLAAVVVVVHHSLLAIPAIAAGSSSTDWLAHTPLHLLWAGSEAVYVFFVLSGLVLTLPVLRAPILWRRYFPSRLVRLYLPVLASVAFAAILVVLVPRGHADGRSSWIDAHDGAVSVGSLLRNASLAAPDWLNSPLWSLRWEVLFSLLLPVSAVLTSAVRRRWWLLVGSGVVASAIGLSAGVPALTYLPMFLIGAGLAVGVNDGGIRVPQRWWPWITVACLFGITASWWLPGTVLPRIAGIVVAGSATGLVASAACWSAARSGLSARVPQRLGLLSFSLYLVHEPIIVTLNLLVPVRLVPLAALVAVPVSLLVAAVFFRTIEAPSHRLAKRAGALSAASLAPRSDRWSLRWGRRAD